MSNGFIYAPPTQPLHIIYEDAYLLVVNKPAGLLSVPGRLAQHQDSSYWRVLQQHAQAKVTHRLDMATSGLLLFAKHREAEVAMSKLFQSRGIYKQYMAVLQGQAPEKGDIDAPLIADWPNRPKQKVDFAVGKAAQTLFHRLAYCEQTDTSRLALEPVTGRSHQLRVHCAHIGHPILGDNYQGLLTFDTRAALLDKMLSDEAEHAANGKPFANVTTTYGGILSATRREWLFFGRFIVAIQSLRMTKFLELLLETPQKSSAVNTAQFATAVQMSTDPIILSPKPVGLDVWRCMRAY